ncbi:MAG TPA: DUF222 domain-containing protein [Sporichthyaceae bacterium]|nr:DUF222 domain-containing protein [Sporichthyaceae bacterium]
MSNTSSNRLMSVEEALDWLAATAGEITWTGAVTDGTDVLARIGVLERQVAMVQGEQVLAMAEWVADSLDRHDAERPVWVDPQTWEQSQELDFAERSAYAEVALELGLADCTSDQRVHVAVELRRRLPGALAALCAGRITMAKARVILEETAELDAELLAQVEAAALGKAEGLTPANLRRATRRAVARLDANAVAKRRATAVAQRSVKMWEIGDGMSALEAILPTPVAQAAFAVIDATAHQAITPGDDRSIDAARADALVLTICFPPDMAPRISYQIQIISTDPDLNADPTRRLPTAAQARYVKARDQHCVHPGCRATRTEQDHTTAHTGGGPTLTTNLALRCRKHHTLKHLLGWTATQDPDGTLTLTTPSGRTY